MSAPAGLRESPRISVVVPHYEDQAGLDAVLAGLRAQRPAPPAEIVVADDGSATAPRVPDGVRVVRQEDRGFRAAAARNLGARAATGQILAFLDGDTVPEPGYLAAVARALAEQPHALVVGTRTHVDEAVDPPRDLGEPQWLRDAWAATDHLRRHDDASFRFVISAVLSCRRETFERLGGFDPTMVGYGGEDWELGWQAVLAGCDLRHEPGARAVHRGADWGGRSAADRAAAARQKNRESLRLAPRITHPIARPAGLVHAVPDILVTWRRDWHEHAGTGAAALAVRDLLAAGDVHVRLPQGGSSPVELREMLAADPRVGFTAGARRPRARARPRFEVELLSACRIPPGQLSRACEAAAARGRIAEVAAPDGTALARIEPVRVRARAALGLAEPGADDGVLRLIRDWPRLSAQLRLEDAFRDEGQCG